MPTHSFRTTAESDAALQQLGVTKGNLSRLVNEAIVALAAWREQAGDRQLDPEVLRDASLIAAVQQDLDNARARLSRLAYRRTAA